MVVSIVSSSLMIFNGKSYHKVAVVEAEASIDNAIFANTTAIPFSLTTTKSLAEVKQANVDVVDLLVAVIGVIPDLFCPENPQNRCKSGVCQSGACISLRPSCTGEQGSSCGSSNQS